VVEAVNDNRTRQRYELDTERGLALIDYQRNGGVVTMLHTEVPAELRGRGIGSALARGALELVRARGEKVIPRCPFIAAYLDKHPEVQNLHASPR
jgi:uncharacterized protein